MNSNPVLGSFDGTMTALDKMIYDLETKLGKAHSKSPFDDIKSKFGGGAPQKEPAQIQEKAAAAEEPAAGQKKDNKEKKEKEQKEKQCLSKRQDKEDDLKKLDMEI